MARRVSGRGRARVMTPEALQRNGCHGAAGRASRIADRWKERTRSIYKEGRTETSEHKRESGGKTTIKRDRHM